MATPAVTGGPTTFPGDADKRRLSVALDHYEAISLHLDDGVTMAEVARRRGVSDRTIQRWVAAYEDEGFAGLIRRPRSDRAKHRVHPDLQRCIEGLALQVPVLTIQKVFEKARDVALGEGWKVPCYGVVYAIVREIPKDLLKMAHEGIAAYEQAFDLLHRREADRPNEVWQADHARLKIWVLDDKGKPRKPWITLIEDDHSRAVAGYHLGFEHPSILRTALALRQAIWRKDDPRWGVCGIPDAFYTDHGSDFKSHHVEQVAAELNMRLVFCTPGKPRGKGKIERFARTVGDMFVSGRPGWAPPGHTGSPKGSASLLTLTELDGLFRDWLVGSYHRRTHGETKQKPLERWSRGGTASGEARSSLWMPRMPDSEEHLDLLLLTAAKPRKVHGDGVHIFGDRYLSPEMGGHVGKSVTVRYDPRDVTEIKVFSGGGFLCRAAGRKRAGQGQLALKDLQRSNRDRRNKLRAEERDRKEAVAKLVPLGSARRPAGKRKGSSPASGRDAPKKGPQLRRWANE